MHTASSKVQFLEKNLSKTINLLSTNNILPINIFVVGCDGAILWVNDRLLREVNVNNLECVLNKNINIFGNVAFEGVKRVVNKRAEEIVEEEYSGNYFITCRCPVIEDQGSVKYVVGISLNVTKIKQAEIAKQAFLQNMAHDLRTPFSAIVGLAQLQEMGTVKTHEEIKSYGKMIHESGSQLLEILNSVIEILNTDYLTNTEKKDRLNLYKFANEMRELITPAIYSSNLALVVEVNENKEEILTDKIRLQQILINLLSNAVKFTLEGTVTLSLDVSYLNNNQDKLIIKVSDTGIGIDKCDHDRIFERFEKIKPSYKSSTFTGCGIGLYLVKQMVNDLKGEITLDSALGKGTTFEIAIPLSIST